MEQDEQRRRRPPETIDTLEQRLHPVADMDQLKRDHHGDEHDQRGRCSLEAAASPG
jgi:hypothetical protein